MWSNTSGMIKENLFFGVGIGNWKIEFPQYQLKSFGKNVQNGQTIYQRPHNDFLWVTSEQGIIGGFSYLLIFIISIYYLFQLIKRNKTWEQKALYTALLAGIIGYILISMVDFPMERIEHSTVFFLILSMIHANYFESFKASKTKNKGSLLLLSIIILINIYSLKISTTRYVSEFHTSEVINYHRKSNWNKMLLSAKKIDISYYEIDPMSIPISWYTGVAHFALGNIDFAKKHFEKAYSITPNNIHVLNNLASCYEKNKKHKEAETLYLKALSISPKFEEAILNLTAVYYNTKDYNKAFETFDRCSINSKDVKYKKFLPYILRSKINLIIETSKDIDYKAYLREINESKENTVNIYFESKRNKINFDDYLKNMFIK
jgi:tetratricopeptide (TPR) repeat protein